MPTEALPVMENRIGDCEICQQACPWNKKHLNNPLLTNKTESFQERIGAWKNFFYLPNLAKLTEKEYRKILGHLNTDIPFKLFHRNVLVGLERAKKMERKSEKNLSAPSGLGSM